MKNRSGYIDIIKFIFALMIVDFHFGTGFLRGGRLAVEGFFMITGYLMMRSIAKCENDKTPLGLSTVRFIAHKYETLFVFLLPSVLLGMSVRAVATKISFVEFLKRFPLYIFELIPLRSAGFSGYYVVGISWYLSAMLFACAILYPLCKKFKSNFTLTVCLPLSLVLYGILSHTYGNLAIGTDFFGESILHTGLMRGLAACSLGCLLYEIQTVLKKKKPLVTARITFTVLEVLGFAFLIYNMHYNPKSKYDYVLIFVIFGLLLIGLCSLSYTSRLLNPKWTKPFGTASILLVLNHYYWISSAKAFLEENSTKNERLLVMAIGTVISCAVVYVASKGVQLVLSKISKIKFFESKEETTDAS